MELVKIGLVPMILYFIRVLIYADMVACKRMPGVKNYMRGDKSLMRAQINKGYTFYTIVWGVIAAFNGYGWWVAGYAVAGVVASILCALFYGITPMSIDEASLAKSLRWVAVAKLAVIWHIIYF